MGRLPRWMISVARNVIRQCCTYLRNVDPPSLVKSLHRDEDLTGLLFDICAQQRNRIVEVWIDEILPMEIDQLASFQHAGGPPNSRKADQAWNL
jgi:hypothetical protein